MILTTLRNKIILFNIIIIVLFAALAIKHEKNLILYNIFLVLGASILSYVLLKKHEK